MYWFEGGDVRERSGGVAQIAGQDSLRHTIETCCRNALAEFVPPLRRPAIRHRLDSLHGIEDMFHIVYFLP